MKANTNTWTWLQTIISIFLGGLGVYYLQQYNTTQEKKQYLDMFIIELQQNQRYVEDMADFLESAYSVEQKVLHKERLSPNDSILLFYTPYFEYEKSAFDMLKISGAIRLINSEEARNSVANIYRNLEIRKRDVNRNMQVKWKLFVASISPKNQDIDGYAKTFNSIINHREMAKHFKELNDSIDFTLSKICPLDDYQQLKYK
ncbi:MAG: hypothetical protein FWD60_00410 [Candidatus Azobacteroides sp.]|nr:hypothetical protein [Candidatus Azobacteroides sp.]